MEHFLLPPSGVGRKCSISSYGCGFPPRALHKEEHIHLQPGILLVPWPSCGLQPFTHLFVGDSIDLTPRIPLAEYVESGRLNWRRAIAAIMVVRHLPVAEYGPAY